LPEPTLPRRLGAALTSLLRSLDPFGSRKGQPLLTLEALRDLPRGVSGRAIRDLCTAVPMTDGMILCRILGRYKLFVDAADFGHSPHLMLDGYWEMWVTAALLRSLRAGMAVADIGANLGYFTLLMADLVGPSGHVHAFEPNPRIMTLLGRSVALNGFADQVTLHAAPLGATDGEAVRLIVPEGEPKNAHLSRTPRGAEAEGSIGHDLRGAALDDIVGDGPLDFVKIDAEGAEQDIWRGMRRLVARDRPMTIFLEFTADRYPAPDAFLTDIAAAGFALSRIDRRRGVMPTSAREVLAAPGDVDQMLALIR
jgi:FkbM family methyltransferase